MALPICAGCAKSQILCASCEAKLTSGSISEFDIEVSRTLWGLYGDKADFTHAIDTEEQVIIIAKDVGGIIGRGGANIKVLSERLRKKVKVIGQDSLKEMAAALVAPARLRGINSIIKPGGKTAYRIRIERADKNLLRMGLDDLRKLISAATDKDVDLAYD